MLFIIIKIFTLTIYSNDVIFTLALTEFFARESRGKTSALGERVRERKRARRGDPLSRAGHDDCRSLMQ
uniref:Uncharacterized protein n=1 Tax=Trichogramma kaykai TaxID=54128 RepID=A0ABD2XC07_9HYME